MSEAASNAFHTVVTDRQLFGRSLIGSLIAAVVSSLLLGGIVVAVAGMTQLIPSGSLVNQSDPVGWFPQVVLDQIVVAINPLKNPGGAMLLLFGALVILILLRAVLRSFARTQISQHVSSSVNRLREHIQRQALRCNPGDVTGKQQQIASNLFQHTARQLDEAAQDWCFRRLTTVCDLIVLTILLLLIQWRIGIECVVPFIVCWYIAKMEADRHATTADLLTEQVDRELEKLTTHLDKSQIVAGYGMEQLEHEQFSSSLKTYQERYTGLRRQKQRARWTSSLIFAAMIALPAFILSRHLVFGELISLPGAAAMAVVLGFFVLSLHRIQDVSKLHGTATVAADAINEYLLRVPAVSQVVGARFLEPMSRLLQFDQVTVETETHTELLTNLDLRIEAGQRVALLALNPLESAALVSLIPRFNDPASGQVLIDGQDIRRVTLESLRAEAVVVGGNEPVFNTTVLENITVGQRELTKQDAIEACKIAHAENFIRQLPKGYETHLGEQDLLTDPGQRFRLSLARAIARKPALLVIQEPETTLDSETKAMLDDTFQRIGKESTLIFVPTRLSTVKRCDRIVMLHQGRVAVDGVHDELVRSSELYRHWEYMRFNMFR